MEVGDLRQFARNFGRWLAQVNPDLDDERLHTIIQQFVASAPIDVGESSALNLNDFCKEAVHGYMEGKSTVSWLEAAVLIQF